jgi:hypothetical protein
MAKIITTEIFNERSTKVHNGKYDYSLVNYIKNSTKVKIICPKEGHGVFEQEANSHLKGAGCPKCAGHIQSNTEEFIQKASQVHYGLYDYSLVNYTNAHSKIDIICNKEGHGVFKQKPCNHLQGNGCPKCAGVHCPTTEEFIQKAKSVHGDLYDYSLVEYVNAITKIIIKCQKKGHGIFEQDPSNHLNGNGCPKCAGCHNPSTEEYIKNATKIHNNRYDYKLVNYINAYTKIEIICKKTGHGIFNVRPADHLQGGGCPKCGYNISKAETDWLDSLKITKENRNLKILNFLVDGYDPNTNTIYEFNGDFWHGNPAIFNPQVLNPVIKKTFGQLHEKTLKREKTLKEAGYNVVSIWEADWKSQQNN